MYSKDEYHESEAERVVEQVRAMLDGLDEETRAVLTRRFPEMPTPGQIIPLKASLSDHQSLIANQQHQAMNAAYQSAAHQPTSGLLSYLFGIPPR